MNRSDAAAVAAVLLVAGHAVAAPTHVADTGAAAALEKVHVTGSRLQLKQAQISGVGPVTVIDAEAIRRSGATSLETLLQRLPASAGGAGNQTNAYWTSNGYGTAQVNLRGLGIHRTLVLLNGRRVVNGGTGANSAVDLNMMPIAMIDRVEVLKDGASAVYGADAVAGVVNVITRHATDGGELAIRTGGTTRGDGREHAVDLSWGQRSDRGSILAGLHVARSGDVPMASRAPCGLGDVGGRLDCVGSSATIGGRALLADGTRVNFNQLTGGDPAGFEVYSPSRHNYNSHASLNAVNPIQRLGLSAFGTFALSEDTELFAETLFSRRDSRQVATPGVLGVYRPIKIAADHPTNPTGQDLVLERRRLAEAGPRMFSQQSDIARVVAGVQGSLGARWDWSAALNWGRNTGSDGTSNVAHLDRVDQTLDREVCGTAPGAAIPCGNYLGQGNLTPEVLRYILGDTRDTGGNAQQGASVNLSGELLDLPAGPVGVAAGAEWRRERGWRNPDALTLQGLANTNRQDPIAGAYTARELHAELSLPLLKDRPLVKALRLNTAARYSDYSLFGGKSTYKAGLDWQVVPTLKLRANASTAFRVPNVPELYGGVSEGNLTTTDPCSNWSALPASSVVHQNCRDAGVPEGFKQLGNTILTTVGGNPALKPEDARTTTAGLVWSPSKALTLTLDRYDIRIRNAIQSVSGSTKLAVCHDTPGLAHQFCDASSFTRDPVTGEIDFLSSQPVNAAEERMSGLDAGALVEFRVRGFMTTLNGELSHLRHYRVRPFPGAEVIDQTGKITGGSGSYTQWRSLVSATLARGPWSGIYAIRTIGAADDINAKPDELGARAPSVSYHSAQLRYAPGARWDVAVGVDNLFDRGAPFVKSYTDANTDTMTYDLLGRRWHVRAGYRW
ncbi:TonB-dependent receptor [Mitsuaria sp. GD03876]|uniref:TonB-dependent receptor n=1 Tax=Mitsuaria sp. GD03876 TaxID=2975399 RepID=UPI00244A23EF|nr:TonB-dependent receptor [Mitsuaria sp. GD03876]MDH0864620.1 TonB-dependent receptor [Mitsuaria sp. GD03876]